MSSEWTLEQAAELVCEHLLSMLDGCDDDDEVRPAIAFDAVARAWAPQVIVVPLECTAGELRRRVAAARVALAQGEMIP